MESSSSISLSVLNDEEESYETSSSSSSHSDEALSVESPLPLSSFSDEEEPSEMSLESGGSLQNNSDDVSFETTDDSSESDDNTLSGQVWI